MVTATDTFTIKKKREEKKIQSNKKRFPLTRRMIALHSGIGIVRYVGLSMTQRQCTEIPFPVGQMAVNQLGHGSVQMPIRVTNRAICANVTRILSLTDERNEKKWMSEGEKRLYHN